MPISPQHASGGESFASVAALFGDVLAWAEARVTSPLPLAQLEQQLLAQGMGVLRALLETLLTRAAAAHDAALPPPPRGGRRRSSTRSLETLFGRVRFARMGVQTSREDRLEFGFDRRLALPAHLYSAGVQERVVLAVTDSSFRTAIDTLTTTTAASLPHRQAQELTQAAACDVEAFYAQPLAKGDTGPKRALLLGSVDSAGVVMTPKALRERTQQLAQANAHKKPPHRDPYETRPHRSARKRMASVFAVWTQVPTVRSACDVVEELRKRTPARPKTVLPRPENKSVQASVGQDTRAWIGKMFDELERRDPGGKRPAVILLDGAKPLQEGVTTEARRRKRKVTLVLDLVHALHHLWTPMRTLEPNEHRRAAVMGVILERLLSEPWAKTKRYLRYLARDGSPQAREQMDACVGYLDRRADQIRYAEFLAAGWPIATGVIEGTCRHLVKDRMDITGARWAVTGAEAVLRLRAVRLNGDWNAYWAFHLEEERKRTYPAQAA